jgi:hypothetical protein
MAAAALSNRLLREPTRHNSKDAIQRNQASFLFTKAKQVATGGLDCRGDLTSRVLDQSGQYFSELTPRLTKRKIEPPVVFVQVGVDSLRGLFGFVDFVR